MCFMINKNNIKALKKWIDQRTFVVFLFLLFSLSLLVFVDGKSMNEVVA